MYQITNNKTSPFFHSNHSKKVTKKSINKKVGLPSNMKQKNVTHKVKMIKVPFSSYIHIDCFLYKPVYGNKTKQNLNFDQNNHQRQFTTTTYYQEQPYCKLAYSNINVLTDLNNKVNIQNQKKDTLPNNFTQLPTGQSSSIGTVINFECDNTQTYPKALLPVVLGEYETEIIINKTIPIKKGITNIVDVSKDIALTNCKFLPTNYSHVSNKMKRYATKGTLFIEGYIDESIEYIPAFNQEQKPPRDWIKDIFYQIDQTIMIELQILLLQQQVIDSNKFV